MAGRDIALWLFGAGLLAVLACVALAGCQLILRTGAAKKWAAYAVGALVFTVAVDLLDEGGAGAVLQLLTVVLFVGGACFLIRGVLRWFYDLVRPQPNPGLHESWNRYYRSRNLEDLTNRLAHEFQAGIDETTVIASRYSLSAEEIGQIKRDLEARGFLVTVSVNENGVACFRKIGRQTSRQES